MIADIIVDDQPASATTVRGVVLVVDDEALVRMNAVEMFEDLGFEVLEAGSGAEALARLQERADIDLLFSDIVMPPGMNGAELARLAQRLRPGLAILLTSGFAGHAVANEDGTDRGYAMIAKPYSGAELNRKIQAAIQEGAGENCPERSSRSAADATEFRPEQPMPAAYGAIL